MRRLTAKLNQIASLASWAQSRARKRLRNVFVIGEFAVALGLLTGAGFMTEAFTTLLSQDPGQQIGLPPGQE